MTTARVVACTLGLLLSLPAAAAAAEIIDRDAPITVALGGHFGIVVGTDPAAPAVAAPDDRPLDTWARGAVLELRVDPPLGSTDRISITASRPGEEGQVPLAIADGRWVTGPAEAGEHVIVATVEPDGAEASQHAWLVVVPDRPGDFETRLHVPPIEARLTVASGGVVGERGHGCLVDICQEVGHRPPPEALEPLSVAVGEPLLLELDDGSAIVHWEGRLEPQPGTASETRLSQATFPEPRATPRLTGLEPDRPGEWLLELRVDYDRERGWQWYLFRLVAE